MKWVQIHCLSLLVHHAQQEHWSQVSLTFMSEGCSQTLEQDGVLIQETQVQQALVWDIQAVELLKHQFCSCLLRGVRLAG